MGQKTINAKKIISQYVKSIQDEIKVDKVLLFGSYTNNFFRDDSDLDVIVLSADFKKMPFMQRLELLSLARTGACLKVPMDIIGYTPEEYKQIDQHSVIMKDAKQHAQVVWE